MKTIVKILAIAKGTAAIAVVGALIWAGGAYINNWGVVSAGQWTLGIGACLTVLFILARIIRF